MLELGDIQGLVFHPYRRHPYASYVLLQFLPGPGPGRWLAELVASGAIDSAVPKETGRPAHPAVRVNIAFSFSGLERVGLDRDALATFPSPFIEGLGAAWTGADTPDHRSRALGDVDASAPRGWDWGYAGDQGFGNDKLHPVESSAVDALLLIFSTTPGDLDAETRHWVERAIDNEAIAGGTTRCLHGWFPQDPSAPVREPFGFADGFSQPVLRGARDLLRHRGRRRNRREELEDGEILLGHRDNSGQIAAGPTLPPAADPDDVLPRVDPDDDDAPKDLGRNGTYLVFRQLAQDVRAFHEACGQLANAAGTTQERFAAQLVGRWHDGAPLITCPIQHDDRAVEEETGNAFGYAIDRGGERCPIGAHIRRTNPRDALGDDPEESWRISSRHRILRRGRRYDDEGSGLHFICLNADIGRQFEFIQQNWINDPTFGGLGREDDPIVGARHGHTSAGRVTLSPLPDDRVHRRVSGLPRFVRVRGGGYFFLPGLTTLRFLAGLGRPIARPLVEPEPVRAAATRDRLRAVYLARVPLLLAATLALLPLLISPLSPFKALSWPMFHVATPLELAGIAMALSVAAAGAQATARLVALHARARFDVDIDPRPLTWRSVLAWQALSLPAVLTIVWLSAFDAVTGGWAVAGAVVRFSFAAVAGYAAAFLILLLAAAARQRNVRPSNPSEMLFLPSNAFFARLKARRLVLWPVAAAVVRFVEARAALWPRRRGAGYINHRNGRVLPGHLANLGLLVALYTVYQLGWSFLRPPHPRVGFQLPPLAYLVLLLLAATLIVSAAAFFLDRYRVPVVSLLLLWLAWGWRSGGTDSVFAVHAPLTRAADVTAALQAADARYGSVGGLGADPPVIIVTAGGGGVHQAAWTAEVLAGLTQLWGRQFTDNLRLVSAVSGGSVGVMPYLEAFDDSGHIPPERLAAVRAAPREPATADVWWGIAYPDTLRVVLPLPLKRRLLGDFDRGWALEQAWRRGAGHAGGAATMNDWRRSVAAGVRPATAFNATVVESGQRAVLATYDIPNRTAAMDLGAVTHDRDIDVTTAVRLSASFPFVTPFARANQPEGSVHVADGGYWDNHGTVAALEWLDAARPAIAARRILAIDIPPLNPPPAASGERSWVWQLTAPFATLGTVRIDGQRARNDIERNWLTRAAGVDVLGVTIAYDAKDASLSWHLTRRERCAIEAAWHAYARDPEARLPALVTLLGRPSSVVITPSEECQR